MLVGCLLHTPFAAPSSIDAVLNRTCHQRFQGHLICVHVTPTSAILLAACVQSAKREVALWFEEKELASWDPVSSTWVYE
jgi:hypothetical protein